MNPPSALHSAMSRERKPFTYTPGGLNLSEIKSERMAKRLMINAMNQGVPEKPVQSIKSPPVSANVAIPNFNCLPVQVFPTFNLPSNPKSLLRTRSNPDQSQESPPKKITPASKVNSNFKHNDSDIYRSQNMNHNVNLYSVNNNNTINNTRPVSMYEYNSIPTNMFDSKTSYGSDGYTLPLLPEKSYDAEYFQITPQGSKALGSIEFYKENNEIPQSMTQTENNKNVSIEVLKKPVTDEKYDVIEITKPLEDTIATDDDQKEVKVQKDVNVTENQNGDANVEAAITVKLPVKKSAAKIETKVQIENEILADGTVEETKTTTTTTTVDGKSEISTKTEKRILSKEEADAVIVVEEEEVEEEVEETGERGINKDEHSETKIIVLSQRETSEADKCDKQNTKENGHDDVLIKQEERQEITTTKKVVILQSNDDEEVVEEEEEEEEEEEVNKIVSRRESQTQESVKTQEIEEEYDVQEADEIQTEEQQDTEDEETEQKEKKTETDTEMKLSVKVDEKEEVEEEMEEKEENIDTESKKDDMVTKQQEEEEEDEEIEEEEEYEEAVETSEVQKPEDNKPEENEPKEETVEEDKLEDKNKEKDDVREQKNSKKETTVTEDDKIITNETEETKEVAIKTVEIPIKVVVETTTTDNAASEEKIEKSEEIKLSTQSDQKIPFREPSIPLEKVIDVEIKPIGLGNDVFTKSHTEIITTSVDKPLGALSTQTEYNRIENIVTVNRTTKTLDQAYEQMIQPSIPTVKTYFAPSRDTVSVSPHLNRPYQPVYTPEPTERRHSLLLERLSIERQLPPADIYSNNYQYNQTEERQCSQEPQSEVLTVSNVKPSTITKNQQWYQQTKKETYNNVTPTINTTPSQQWNQAQPQTQQQPQYQSQPQTQFQSPQPQYQSSQPQYQSPQPQYQSPQPQYQSQPQHQYQSQPQPQYQQQYQPQQPTQSYNTENIIEDTYKTSNNYSQNLYPTYSPKPTSWSSNIDTQSSYLKDSTETYQKSTQEYSSSYVPPPWEQGPGYVADAANQNYHQPSTPTTSLNTSKPGWKPTPPLGKFTKPKPTSYIPPAPNQSFVKSVSNEEPPKLPGRKTYYSEYERRYISVPESTYIPTESKYQAQPDPSPKYYYDNNEPVETVEPQWRKELREFTEKTSQTTVQTEQTSVRPPWEEDSKYIKTEFTPTPTWSQTLKPRSGRERSFESDYVGSKEWPKTNTLGRGRPVSSYVKSGVDSPIPERTRGVSVDRYNPNNYQSPIPSEHPPVQSHTLNPNVQPQNYHNPNVPAYNARVSVDNREQAATLYQQPRQWGESRATPLQSRSFKYLQWITGTED